MVAIKLIMDTQYFNFSLKENATFWTEKFVAGSHTGKIWKITVSPMDSMIKTTTSGSTKTHYVNALGLTLSRFREIKYIGTRLAIKPLATNGSVDPAHIQQTAANSVNPTGVQGTINPYDSNNYYHCRRWIGGNFNIPNMTVNDVQDQLRLDNMWMNDDRFIHKNVNEDFETFATPLRASVDMGASATNTLFGFYDSSDVSATSTTSSGGTYQKAGWLALSGTSVHEEGWLPNPMAGFDYADDGSGTATGMENFTISGVNTKFPWFADNIEPTGTSFTVDKMVEIVKERFYQPIAIMRFPAAYSTCYGWRMYLSHEFSARKPYIVNSAWIAGKVTEEIPGTIIRTQLDLSGHEQPVFEMKEKEVDLLSALPCDPYAVDDVPNTITMSSGMKFLGHIWNYKKEPDHTNDQLTEEPDPAESIPHN